MKPSAANPLKRAGFLEVRPKQSHFRVGLNRHWRISLSTQRTADFIAQSAAVFRSLRLQENLPLRAEQGRCCPAWATENVPDPQFRRVVLRHRKAKQGVNRFSGERSEPKPRGRLISAEGSEPKPSGRLKNAPREIGTQANWSLCSNP
jgi:hypothetical protein